MQRKLVGNPLSKLKTTSSILAGKCMSHPRICSLSSSTRPFTNASIPHQSSKADDNTTRSIKPSLPPPSSAATSSVSSDEVSKFSSMASTWWDPDQNPLISMNPTRVKFIIQSLSQHDKLIISKNNNTITTNNSYEPLRGLKALDVGCGGGLLSESLARLGANVTAIDPSEKVAEAAYEHSKLDPSISNRLDYRGGTSVEDLALELTNGIASSHSSTTTITSPMKHDDDDLYDMVCILEVIEHATDPNSLLQSAASLLKKPDDNGKGGGMLFVSTINRTIKSYTIAIVGGEYVTGKLPIGTHSWVQFKSPQEVNDMVGMYGLGEVDVTGMILKPPFFDLRWDLNKSDTDVNWIGAYSHSGTSTNQ